MPRLLEAQPLTVAPKAPARSARWKTLDANEAVASVAYRLNELIAIYPITPSSAMAESCDEWSAAGKPNLWGEVPQVMEMQSEGGAAGGRVHQDKFSIGDYGFRSLVFDTEGNMIGLHSMQ